MWAKETKEEGKKEEKIILRGQMRLDNLHLSLSFRRSIVKARVEPDICIGCTLCVQTCPQVFRMEGDKAVAYVDVVPQDAEDVCRQATDECPVTAIIIE